MPLTPRESGHFRGGSTRIPSPPLQRIGGWISPKLIDRNYTLSKYGAEQVLRQNSAMIHIRFSGITKRVSTILILGIAASLLPACAPQTRIGSVRIGYSKAGRIAKDMSLPGKGVEGQCLPFANALHQKFAAAGIPSKIIVYHYTPLSSPVAYDDFNRALCSDARNLNAPRTHAVVAYNDDGRTYIMDNQSWYPTWIHDASPTEMAQQFSGMDLHVDLAQTR